jgi:hypothetical protein
MTSEPDDELYRVDAVYLGPQRLRLPWTARYSAYGLFLAGLLATGLVEKLVGLTRVSGAAALVIAVLAGVLIARLVGKKVTYERPLRAVPVLFWADLAAPRQQGVVAGPGNARHRRAVTAWLHEPNSDPGPGKDTSPGPGPGEAGVPASGPGSGGPPALAAATTGAPAATSTSTTTSGRDGR